MGFSGDGGQATAAELSDPWGVIFDAAGNLYITDAGTSVIRKVNTAGIISTVAGNGTMGFSGDGGQATATELNQPVGIILDASGNLYFADNQNSRIRMINTSGIISTIVGNGTAGYSGDGGQATSAKINRPWGITFDAVGNLYIADEGNNVVRKVTNVGQATGIEQVASINERLSVYPNPAANSLQVAVNTGYIVQYILYDVLGKEVIKNEEIKIKNGVAQIVVSSLNDGVYFIKVKTTDSFYSKKIIVQH
jgi:hypothetical protein